jgi:uncharacterized protein
MNNSLKRNNDDFTLLLENIHTGRNRQPAIPQVPGSRIALYPGGMLHLWQKKSFFCGGCEGMPNDEELRRMLHEARTIAVVGAKDAPGTDVDRVGRYLIRAGYNVIPVHPVRKTVWERAACPTLADAPQSIDIVNVFRAPAHCPDHAGECLALATMPKVFWMQLGISHPDVEDILAELDTNVVQNRCIMVEHARLIGPV